MEVEKALADCFELLLQNGLNEEHKFAVGVLDCMLTYVSSKGVGFTRRSEELQKEEHKSESEEGEIVVVGEADVKVEVIEGYENKNMSAGIKENYMSEHNTESIPKTINHHLIEKKQKYNERIEEEPSNGIKIDDTTASGVEECKQKTKNETLKSRNFAQSTKDGPISYECQYCSFSLENSKQGPAKYPSSKMRRHMKKEHSVCEVCREKQDSPDQLANHMTFIHTNSSGQMMCGIGGCKAVPNNSKGRLSGILNHVNTTHDRLTYICGECRKSYRFWNKHVLLYHSSDSKDIFTCTHIDCQFRTLSHKTLSLHQKRVHPDGKKKHVGENLSCDLCDFTTNGTSASAESERMKLLFHMKVHRDGNIVCDLCEFTTKKKFTFQKHRSVKHNIGYVYQCDICDYRTGGHSGKTHFKAHMEMHSGEKSFMCDKCDFKSSTGELLRKHMRRHEETPRYLCDGCDYKSHDISNFNAHKKVKHGTEILSCKDCDFTTKSDRTLRNHISKKHTTPVA